MANTYNQLYIQTVFAVKYRQAKIDKKWQHELFAVMGNLINESGCKTIIVNGEKDHVHCFFGLKPTISISELMRDVKSKSSKYINENKLTASKFEWQDGYGAFSYSHSQINNVFNYIKNQENHHKNKIFKDEYRDFLEKFEVSYDEKYIFEELT